METAYAIAPLADTGLLERNTFFVKQHIAMFRAGNRYEVKDPTTGKLLVMVEEEVPNFFLKLLKFTSFKSMLPFTVFIRTAEGKPLMTVKRGFTFLVSKVRISDASGQPLGTYQQRFWSIGGKFDILNRFDELVATLKGNIIGWTFTFRDKNEQELAVVTRKWAGVGKELFTSADNYVVDIKPGTRDGATRMLIMAAAFCIDMVFKNQKSGVDVTNLLDG